MNVAEGWNMYLEIQDLKKVHFNVSRMLFASKNSSDL